MMTTKNAKSYNSLKSRYEYFYTSSETINLAIRKQDNSHETVDISITLSSL